MIRSCLTGPKTAPVRAVLCWKYRVTRESWDLKCDENLSSVNLKRSIFISGTFYYLSCLYSIQYQQTQFGAKGCIKQNVLVMSHECWRNMYGLYCGVWCDIPFPAVSKARGGLGWPNLCGAWYHLGSVLSSTHRDVTFFNVEEKIRKSTCKSKSY